MRRINLCLLLILFSLNLAAGQYRTEFRDFSQKGAKYKVLENLRFAINDIIYFGDESINILGKSLTASKYSLNTNVKVQTLCAIGAVNEEVYETKSANFEIFIVEDKDKFIHNTFIKLMYDIWSKKESYSGEYFFDFNTKDNEYALTIMPHLVNEKEFYYIWVKGRLIKVVFKSFQSELGGWGVMDSFNSDNLRVKISNLEFVAYKFPLSPKKNFLKLYKAGFFQVAQNSN